MDGRGVFWLNVMRKRGWEGLGWIENGEGMRTLGGKILTREGGRGEEGGGLYD